jgi:hypothetical protein
MHIHSSQMNLEALNPYSAAAEKAAAAKRAEDVRKKLMKSATDIEGISGPDEAYLVSQWMDPLQSQQQPVTQDDEYHPSTPGRIPDFG